LIPAIPVLGLRQLIRVKGKLWVRLSGLDFISYHVRSITLHQVGAGSPTISANNLQSQKPARPGYYRQSIAHDITFTWFDS
jgi:hypothetical protein